MEEKNEVIMSETSGYNWWLTQGQKKETPLWCIIAQLHKADV